MVTVSTKTSKLDPLPASSQMCGSKSDWPLNILQAYTRYTGPYTIHNVSTLLEEESLELYNGWLVWQAMTNAQERRIAGIIQEILSLAARACGFGQAYPDQFECLMTNGDTFKPDVCLISDQRFETQVGLVHLQGGGEHQVLKGGPELVVEIRSPSNRRNEERKKRSIYFASGTQVVWDVDPKRRRIWVYEAVNPLQGQEYKETDEISCAELLPGWRRTVGDFFTNRLTAEQIVGQAASEWRAASEQKGRAEGEQKGRVEGELEALHRVLLLQASARFGLELPADLTERLAKCEIEQLFELATTLATVSDLATWLTHLPA